MKTTTKTALVAIAVTIGAAGIATAYAADGKRAGGMRGDGPRAEMRFERIDADGDGAVTFTEFFQPMAERFAEADADANGLVTFEEIVEAADNRRAARMAGRMISRFDVNGDGQLAIDEIESRQQKQFALLDFDESGSVTEDELPRRFAGGHRGGHRGGDRGGDRGGE